jgi:hypothetical protein
MQLSFYVQKCGWPHLLDMASTIAAAFPNSAFERLPPTSSDSGGESVDGTLSRSTPFHSASLQ